MISVKMWGIWHLYDDILSTKPLALLGNQQEANGFINQRFWRGIKGLKTEEVEVGWGMPVAITMVPRKSPEPRPAPEGPVQKMIRKALPRTRRARTIT